MKILILFDVDGTLVCSTNRQDSLSFATAYKDIYQRPFPTIDWHQYPHVTDKTIIQTVITSEFQRAIDPKEIKIFQNHYLSLLEAKRKQNPEHYCEVPGARKTMEWLLHQNDFNVGIATGGWVKPAEVKLTHAGIPFGDFPISGADGQTTREEIIHQALHFAREGGTHFDKIVYVGDALWDVQTTRNLQMDFVGIRRRNDLDILTAAGAQTVLQNFLDRDQFLEAIFASKPPL